MTEQGSDQLFAELADIARLLDGVRADDARRAAEEERVRAVVLPVVDDEPGEQYPDPDEAPPAADAPQFDPTPPAA